MVEGYRSINLIHFFIFVNNSIQHRLSCCVSPIPRANRQLLDPTFECCPSSSHGLSSKPKTLEHRVKEPAARTTSFSGSHRRLAFSHPPFCSPLVCTTKISLNEQLSAPTTINVHGQSLHILPASLNADLSNLRPSASSATWRC